MEFSEESEEDGFFYYQDEGMKVPYQLDEADLSYIEQSLHHQYPLGQIRSASLGSDTNAGVKAKISSLLGTKTKDSTSGKENYEDMNNNESPLFDEEFEQYYVNGKNPYMFTQNGEIVMLQPDPQLSESVDMIQQQPLPCKIRNLK
jgi:hypothetical protein